MGRYEGKRVLVTCLDRYMGKPAAKAFEAEGAEVITDNGLLQTDAEVDALLERAGNIDILIANFAEDPLFNGLGALKQDDWTLQFNNMVYPLIRLVNKITPNWIERGHGKIISVTSAAPLRGMPSLTTYCSARGAQNGFVRAAGLELAPHNIQFNAIAQNFVKNERYFPDEFIESEEFKTFFLPQIPTGKVAEEDETAELMLYLASEKCTHMVGQVLPWAGGWATTTG